MNTAPDPQHPSKVFVAVLHYTGLENTRACLESVKRLDYKPFEILVTDNCSPDGSGKLIAQEYPDCHHLSLPDNLGFAGGSNAGINWCIERGAEWIWILNNDTEVDPSALSQLMEIANKQEKAGIIGATIYTPEKNGFSRSGTGTIDFKKAKTFERGAIDDNADFIECQWVSGCNMLIRASAFKQMQGFDERFFLYFEDTDLCWRMNQSNWKCLFAPKAKITHAGGASTQGKLAVWRSYYYTRNRLLFFMKNRQGADAIPALISIYSHLLRHSLVLPFRGESGRRQLKAELLGLSDYINGKFGKATCLDF